MVNDRGVLIGEDRGSTLPGFGFKARKKPRRTFDNPGHEPVGTLNRRGSQSRLTITPDCKVKRKDRA